tara:strand:- start:12620 stop:12919 length:300 start_codon:yes stop_codon:yes gene_type:complete
MAISNDKIYNKLLQIEKYVKAEFQEEKIIETKEEEIEALEKRKNIRFPDIGEWRKLIWENCPHKKELDEGREIDWLCGITKQACHFENCPENEIDEKKK